MRCFMGLCWLNSHMLRDSARSAMGYLGYSTTHLFYGQHPYFMITRWQGMEGDPEKRKCKEFSTSRACEQVSG
jgi:hypothetical protein